MASKIYLGVTDFQLVTFDDRLPCAFGKNRLLYAECQDPREFWVAIMEKAYAKLHGNYESIEAGFSGAAMSDLTGEGNQKMYSSDNIYF